MRAADGTSCRSAVGGDGSYLDFGAVASPGTGTTQDSGAVYSRVVIPLGVKPRRLDCSALYDLEVQRLRMELKLARLGLGNGSDMVTQSGAARQNADWSTEGLNSANKHVASPLPTKLAAKPVVAPKISPVADKPVEIIPARMDAIY